MSNPRNDIFTVFDFYINSLEEITTKSNNAVGYEVKPADVWSMNIQQGNELNNLHVTLVLIYWKVN